MTIPRILSSKAYSWAVDGPMQWLIKGFKVAFCITGRHSRNYSGVQAKARDATSDAGVHGHRVGTPLLPSASSTQSRRHSEGMNEGGEWTPDTEVQRLLRSHDNTPGITVPTGQYSQSNTTLSLILAVLSNKQHYQRLLDGASPDEAQILFELCQTLLDSYEITCEHRGQIIALMQRLSGKTETFPSYFFIRGPISLVHEQPINSGGFGDIYKATLHHETLCLKVLRERAEPKSFKTFAKEYILWSQFSHPNLLPFYGLHEFRSGQVSLVSPWAENGTLQDFLSSEMDSNTTIDRILLCLDVAVGVEHLHKLGVVHGDIKSTNVLVDRVGRLYLADFGLSSVHDPQILHWTSQSLVASKGGTVRWQAPELYQDMSDPGAEEFIVHNTKMSDVFALGTVMLKVMKGQVPSRPSAQDPAWLTYGLNERGWNMMEACWAFDPMARPAMAAIVFGLKLERPATFKDPRSSPQWPPGSAVRFRNSQNVGRAGPAHTLEDLKAILSRVTGLEI
ncbi:hypothetical protein DXG01_009405 [Tephrocybe rancida]|nr:hypothetical protein DXG01_009405 [Tephrocybe rancida]